jgi:hypothetical protein
MIMPVPIFTVFGFGGVILFLAGALAREKRNAGVSPLRRQSAPPSVEMTISLC